MTHPISLLIGALGGEGGGVLTEWLVATALHAGYAAQATSIPGVAQRTGATTYYVEVFPVPMVQLQGRRPVFSLNPVPGALDGIVSSELLETARLIGNGMSSPERTLVLSSSSRTLTTQERMQMGDGRIDTSTLLKLVRRFSREHHVLDMEGVAREAGAVVSAVMLGAVAGSGLFPFAISSYEAVIRAGRKSVEANLRGFGKGFELVSEPRKQAGFVGELLAGEDAPIKLEVDKPQFDRLVPFPPQTHDMLSLGYARMLEYQGEHYADLYLQRLQRVLSAERSADPASSNAFAITREMARWLALWMAFDDIVRVADLKSRVLRLERVKNEVRVADDDLLQIYDHFKPGVPEVAALLPSLLANRLLLWDRARVLAGKSAWALPLKVGTHSVLGMVALRTLASLKWLRKRGSRFSMEQAMIEKWLTGVVDGTQRGWSLGHEIALCGRLVKGYGATNERGKENLLHVLDHLARSGAPEEAAIAVSKARVAALTDDAGIALDKALLAHGAPARPVKAQPIRFVRNLKH